MGQRMRIVSLAGAALLLLASVAHADQEFVFVSEFTIVEAAVFWGEGNLMLDPQVHRPESEGWFETQVLWLYLDTNRAVTVTAVGVPYTHVELDIALPTEAQGAYGRRTDAELLAFGWLTLGSNGVLNLDLPGRYTAWIALRVLRSGYNDLAGRYVATVTITLSQ